MKSQSVELSKQKCYALLESNANLETSREFGNGVGVVMTLNVFLV